MGASEDPPSPLRGSCRFISSCLFQTLHLTSSPQGEDQLIGRKIIALDQLIESN